MSRTYRRKGVSTPTWWWKYEENPKKFNAWFHSDACFGGSLTEWAKKQLRREARARLNEMLMKAICNGTEDELSLPKEHLASDKWSYD